MGGSALLIAPARSRATHLLRIAPSWLLMIPLVFFAARGTFSFFLDEPAYSSGAAELSALSARRDLGFLGYVLLPGITYSIVFYLLANRLQRVLDLALQTKALTLLPVLSLASVLWSQNPDRSLLNGTFCFVGEQMANKPLRVGF